jgi:DNA-binding MarR family transcriptional regulator
MHQGPKLGSVDLLLGEISRMHHGRVRALLESLGLYRGQPRVLFALWEREGQTHSELAQRTHVSAATISKMVQRMEKAGFLERRADERDQRVSRVYLTETGRAVQDRVSAASQQLEEEALAGFSDEECALIRQFLGQIRDNLASACTHRP